MYPWLRTNLEKDMKNDTGGGGGGCRDGSVSTTVAIKA